MCDTLLESVEYPHEFRPVLRPQLADRHYPLQQRDRRLGDRPAAIGRRVIEAETDFEVELKMEASAGEGADTMFNVELTYGGVFRLANLPEEAVAPAILIECPRLLFPFARQVIADATRNGGFPPLMIDPVDFAALFQQRMAEEQAKQKVTN